MFDPIKARGRVNIVDESKLDEFVKHRRNDVRSNVAEYKKRIAEGKALTRRTIQEEPFKKFFLPVMAGLIKDLEICDKIDKKWTEICGSPWEEVYVLDRFGNLVITCPPILSSKIFVPSLGETKRVFNMLRGIDRIREINPSGYNQAMEGILEQAVFSGLDDTAMTDVDKSWVAVFQHYADHLNSIQLGIPQQKVAELPKPNVVQIAQQNSASDQGFVDDEDF